MADDEEWKKVANARRPLEISPWKGCLLSKLTKTLVHWIPQLFIDISHYLTTII